MRLGDKVMYGKVQGEITGITGDTALVRLEDGQEYPVHTSGLTVVATKEVKATVVGSKFSKKPEDLGKLAKELQLAGISEFTVKNGEVINFKAKESLAEKKAKFREAANKAHEEAMAEADKEAEEEFKNENEEE